MRVANVFEDRIDTTDLKEMDFTGVFERFRLDPGDVLLNEGQSPELLGRPAIYRGSPEEVGFTNTLLRFKPYGDVLSEWALLVFRHYMHSGRFVREARITTNIAHLSGARFKSVEFPVPPVDEQRRIVEILEDHLSRLDAADAQLRAALSRGDPLMTRRMNDLLSECDGKTVEISQLAQSLRNGIFVSRPVETPNGAAILRIGAVRSMSLHLEDLRYTGIGPLDPAIQGFLLNEGDLLFTRYNGNPRYVGACAVVPRLSLPLTYPDKLIRVQIQGAIPTFVALSCNYGEGRSQIRRKVKTTAGQSGISGRDLRSVKLCIPPIDYQEAVVSEWMELSAGARRLSDQCAATLRTSAVLRRAVLAAAFEGRLTGRRTDDEIIEETTEALR